MPIQSTRTRDSAQAHAAAARAPRVDAIIVNWNGRRYLPSCLAALKASVVPVKILVVDNASADDSVAYVTEEHADVGVLRLGQNVGYAAGANAGIQATSGDYVLIMNADVLLAPEHIARLIRRLDIDPSIGAAQGKLYQIDAEDFLGQRVRTGGRLDSAGHVIRRSRMVVDRGQGEPDGPAFNVEASVFSACGAALFLRRSMLEDLAGDGECFCTSFFAYKEDIDLCWRARTLGWDVRYVPDAVAHHVRTAPFSRGAWRQMPLAARRHSWKNHYLLMVRNDRAADVLRALPFIATWEMMRLGHAILRDPRVLTAFADLARALSDALRARRALLRRRSATPVQMRHWFSGVTVPVAAAAKQTLPVPTAAAQ